MSEAETPAEIVENNELPRVRYPHQTGEPVTPESLRLHMTEHPEAYPEALRPHIERVIGSQATREVQATPEAETGLLSDEETKTLANWLWTNNGDNPDFQDLKGAPPPVALDKRAALSLAAGTDIQCTQFAENITKFEGLDEQVVDALFERGGDGFVNPTPTFIGVAIANGVFENVNRTTITRRLVDAGYQEFVANRLYSFRPDAETLGKIQQVSRRPIEAYPADGNSREQDEWFARNAYVYLEGPWPLAKVGRIIRKRIELGLEDDLHEASLWLAEFQIPANSPDVAYIKGHRLDSDFDPGAIPNAELIDYFRERELLKAIVNAPVDLRQRLLLSDKPEAISQLFADPLNQCLYWTLMSGNDGQPLYRLPELSHALMVETAEHSLDEFLAEFNLALGQGKTGNFRLGKAELAKDFDFARGSQFYDDSQPDHKIRKLIHELKALGLRRKAYVDDAAEWLFRHQTSPDERLTKVWKDRAMALAYGTETDERGRRVATVEDSAISIERWQKENAFKQLVDTAYADGRLADLDFSREELLGEEWRAMREELGRVMSAENMLGAMASFRDSRETRDGPDKLLPAANVSFSLEPAEGQKSHNWRFEILDQDDPRGFTIGADTGCCMTFGGVSEVCINAGFQFEEAGFIALYGPDGKLNAQSFWYINRDFPDTLVLDNIEANEGRDFNKIIPAYREGLRRALQQLSEKGVAAARQIRFVNMGEGYSDVDFSAMERVEPVPPLYDDIYTDAEEQRRLLVL